MPAPWTVPSLQALTGNAVVLTIGISLAFLGINLMVLYMRQQELAGGQ